MDTPFVSQQDHAVSNFLIVDREGEYGLSLAENLSGENTVVFVSRMSPQPQSAIIHIPFGKSIPVIPDGTYSHMFFVWTKESEDLLDPLLQKIEETKGKCVIVISYTMIHEWLSKLHRVPKYAVLAVVGDVFGTPPISSDLDIWLEKVKRTKKIHLAEMGLVSSYPILYQDILDGLISLAFTRGNDQKTILLAPQHPKTFLALSHALQKIDPDIRIDFKEEREGEKTEMPEGQIFFHNYPVVEKIQEAYKKLIVKEQQPVSPQSLFVTPEPIAKTVSRPVKKKSTLPFLMYFLFVLFITPVIASFGCAWLGKTFLEQGILELEKGNFTSARQEIQAAQSQFDLAQAGIVVLRYELFGNEGILLSLKNSVNLGQQIASIGQTGTTGLENVQQVLLGKSLKPQDDLILGANSLKNAFLSLSQISLQEVPSSYQKKLTSLMQVGSLAENVLDVVPSIMGNGDKTYMVLLENNMELRPGGGFIGSYGIVKFHNGRFVSFVIRDVYDSDGQLKGHIEPPFALRRYMPIVHLYLRDSNFDVDFVENAKKAAFVLEQETGEKVDGVVGVDLNAVKAVVGAVGSVYVPGYNQTVTADNFFLLTEQHAEKNFFAGSTQKKDFLNAFFVALQGKMLTGKFSKEQLLSALASGILQKDLLFAFANPSVQNPFTVNGLSSSLWDGRAKTDINDYVGINEANLGVNKANYFVSRTVAQKVLVGDDGTIRESLAMSFTNSSQVGVWPGGVYKNYLRVILPQGTTLQEIQINGISQKMTPAITDPKIYEAKGFHAPQGLEVEQTQEEGKSIFGFLVQVSEQKTMTVTISYTLPTKVPLNAASSTYSLFLFKQPGIGEYPYSLDISYPEGYTLLFSSEQVTKQNHVVSYNQNITTDKMVTMSFSKEE